MLINSVKNYNSFVSTNKTRNNRNFCGKFDGLKNILDIRGSETSAKVFTDNIDYKTYAQIKNICSHPVFRHEKIRIMPDAHSGKTAVVGFTAPVKIEKGVIPSLISGDIGCGMLCIELDTKGQQIDFEALDNVVKTYISGERIKTPTVLNKYGKQIDSRIDSLCKDYKVSSQKSLTTLGTLGGGNHFIEIDKDKAGKTFLVIHTGSRAFGKEVFNHYDKIAREQNPYKLRDLSYLTNDEAKQYLDDMKIAIKYSQLNRRIIADEILKQMGWKEKSSFETIHNYISSDGIMRKGAIESNNGEKLLIPLNMKDGAIIGTGKGNPEWNNSAPHGAGRQFSRSEASELIDLEDYQKSMEGIYTTSVSKSTIDESPFAYKDANEIINRINDTAEIDDIIKPIYNHKG